MQIRRAFLAAAAVFMLPLGVTSVAADDWCDVDPPVQIQTPAGRTIVVKITDYALGAVHLPALGQMTYSYVATPTADGQGTDVTLVVNIPTDLLSPTFQTRSKVSSAADENSHVYQVYSDLYGTAGGPIVHQFTLSVR